jgi:putative intracellular protease/amidase
VATVVIALADAGFDPTEMAVPWRALTDAGHDVEFATERGTRARADEWLLTETRLGRLAASPEAQALYHRAWDTQAFQRPIRFAELDPARHAALVLPGGHAPCTRQVLECTILRERALAFHRAGRTIAAICHGPVVLARTIDGATGRSILHGRRVTALPKHFEAAAWLATAWRLGDYYRTYPTWVQDEVSRAAGGRRRFCVGPWLPSAQRPFAVRDGNLVTARWPGDAGRFAQALLDAMHAARA